MTTNKDQLKWLRGIDEAGKLGSVGAADVIVDGEVKSLPGDEALSRLLAMGEDELAASLSAELPVAQGDGDPDGDPGAEPETEQPAPESDTAPPAR